jgi:hypothetical protein
MGTLVHVCHPDTQEAEPKGLQVEASLGYIVRPNHKQTKQNKNKNSKELETATIF